MAIIKLPLTKTSKPKRKPGTRAGLTKSAIAADATKLIETVGPGEFSVRKLASAMGVGPTSIHAHFKGGTEAVLDAVAAKAPAGTTRPFKPMEEPAEYLRGNRQLPYSKALSSLQGGLDARRRKSPAVRRATFSCISTKASFDVRSMATSR